MIIISDSDLQRINEGSHSSIYEKLGAHVLDLDGSSGAHFCANGGDFAVVWRPDAAFGLSSS